MGKTIRPYARCSVKALLRALLRTGVIRGPQTVAEYRAASQSGWVILQADGRDTSKVRKSVLWHLASKLDGTSLLRPQSRHPFCVMEGTESYDAFRDSLSEMLDEINELQGSMLTYTAPDGREHKVRLQFLLTGDNKFTSARGSIRQKPFTSARIATARKVRSPTSAQSGPSPGPYENVTRC